MTLGITLNPYRCETCVHFVGKMKNYFGVDQPFCKNPKMIQYYKDQPKDPGRSEDGQHCWPPLHVVMEGDLWYHPMNGGEIRARNIMGCLSHSDFPQIIPVSQEGNQP
jgi:hypothetical protein